MHAQDVSELVEPIQHRPWPVPSRPWMMAQVWHAIRLPDIAPMLHFSRRQEVAVWGLQRLL